MKHIYTTLGVAVLITYSCAHSTQNTFQSIDSTKNINRNQCSTPCSGCTYDEASDFDVVQLLTSDQINAQNVLQNDIYLESYPINSRPLFTYPFVTKEHYCNKPYNKAFTLNLFFNYTAKKKFTSTSVHLSDYIDLLEPDILEEIDIKQFTNINVPELIGLFAPAKMEERRLGGIFQGHMALGCNTLQMILPLYYLERNLHLYEGEMLDIANQPVFSDVMNVDVETYLKAHLLSDQIGLGDLTLGLERCVLENTCNSLYLQGRITLPTAAKFKEGLIGKKHSLSCTQPPFSLKHVYELATSADAGNECCKNLLFAYLSDFGTAVLDQLTANIAKSSLGQQAFSIGAQAVINHDINSYMGCSFCAYGDFFLGKKTNRLLLEKINPADFSDATRHYDNEPLAAENLAFLNNRLIQIMYPPVRSVSVYQKGQIGGRLSFISDTPYAMIRCGYDMWYKSKDKLEGRCLSQFQYDKAIKPYAYQGKLFGDISVNRQLWCLDLNGTLSADVTVDDSGIGKDWTLALIGSIEF